MASSPIVQTFLYSTGHPSYIDVVPLVLLLGGSCPVLVMMSHKDCFDSHGLEVLHTPSIVKTTRHHLDSTLCGQQIIRPALSSAVTSTCHVAWSTTLGQLGLVAELTSDVIKCWS
eukprot:5652419-Amphidinium_carterae.1